MLEEVESVFCWLESLSGALVSIRQVMGTPPRGSL